MKQRLKAKCPWCGKPFQWKEVDGWIEVLCPYSDCLVVPSGRFDTVENAEKLLGKIVI